MKIYFHFKRSKMSRTQSSTHRAWIPERLTRSGRPEKTLTYSNSSRRLRDYFSIHPRENTVLPKMLNAF